MAIRPPKLLPIEITEITPNALWTVDDGSGDPYINSPFRWTVVMAVTAQRHSYHLSQTPGYFNGLDIAVGDWIATTAYGIANRIVSISAQTPTEVTCIVEDVDRYNTFADPQGMGVGIGPLGNGFLFEMGEDGEPVLAPIKPGVLPPEFQVDLLSRFRHQSKPTMRIVADIAARNALTGVEDGDQVFVSDAGNGEWATYIWDGAWILTNTADTSDTDAETLRILIEQDDASPYDIGEVSAGSRVTQVTVKVLTPMSDPLAVITIGDADDHDRLMSGDQSDLTESNGVFQVFPVHQYEFDTMISAYFDFRTTIGPGHIEVIITYT